MRVREGKKKQTAMQKANKRSTFLTKKVWLKKNEKKRKKNETKTYNPHNTQEQCLKNVPSKKNRKNNKEKLRRGKRNERKRTLVFKKKLKIRFLFLCSYFKKKLNKFFKFVFIV